MSHDIPNHYGNPNAQHEANPYVWTDLTNIMRESGVPEDTISALVEEHRDDTQFAHERLALLQETKKAREQTEVLLRQTEALPAQRPMGAAALKDFGRVAGSIDTPSEKLSPRVEYTQPHFPSPEGMDLSAESLREHNRVQDLKNRE
jgi:hypothetical protein